MKKVIKSFALKCAVVAHLVILSMVSGVFGQATVVNNNPNATQIAAGLNANGLVINNPQIVRGGSNNQIAIFSNGINGANLGVDAGVLFSTGHAVNELTKKNSSSSSSLQSSVSAQTGTYSDAQLTNITSNAIYDAVVYTFDITLTGGADALRIAYQFGSEEYPDYVGSVYNDTFGFFVRRKGTTGAWINMARLPNAAQTVTAINKVNFGKQGNNYSGTGNGYESSNSNHYERNGHTTTTTSGNPNRLVLNNNPGPFPIHVEYNGLTKLIQYDLSGLIQGGTYEFKIAIADAGDRNLDAGVFVSKIEGVFGADLAIQKAVDKSTPCIGDIVEFTLTAKNVGPADATGVQVTDLLPSGFEYDSHTAPSGTTYTPSTGIWNIGNLALYGERVLKIRAKVKSTGVYTNQATITGTKNDPDATNDKAQVTVVPSVPQITIGTGGATICAGSTTQLTGSGTPATSGAWTSSNPSVATVNNSGLVTGVSDGTATITYKNANGCTANVVVDVKPKPTVNVVDNKDFCNGASSPVVTFGSNVTGTTYSWTNDNTSIGLAASGTGNLPAFTATNTGTFPITATITVTPSANGCTGTPRTFTIKVNPTPPAPTVVDQVTYVGATGIAYDATATAGHILIWYSDLAGTAVVAQPAVSTAAPGGTFTAYVAQQNDDTGCISIIVPVKVTVNPVGIKVTKTVDKANINEPTTLTYNIEIENTGQFDLTNIQVSDVLSQTGIAAQNLSVGAVTESISPNGVLNIGEKWTYALTYNVLQLRIDNGNDLVNTVSVVTKEIPGSSTATATTKITQTSSIALVKTHDQEPSEGEDCVELSVNDEITYTFVVTNRGNTTLNNISIVDEMAGLSAITSSESGVLAPGASRTYSATYSVTQSDINAGVIRNTATATAVSPLGDVSDVSGTAIDNNTPTELPICQTDGIALVKTHDQQPGEGENCLTLEVDDVVTYTFVVTNRGNTTLNNINIVDEMAGLSAITSIESGALAPGASRTYSATYSVTQSDINAGVIRNTATATAVSPLGDVSDVSGTTIENDTPTELPICQTDGIALVKTHDQQPSEGEDCVILEVDDVVTYTFVVTNRGNTTLNNINIVDEMAGLSAITSIESGALAPGASRTYSATYSVTQSDINAGVIRNTATATAVSPLGDVSDVSGTTIENDTPTELPICQTDGIALVKTHDQQPGEGEDCVILEVDDVVTYTFVVTNRGNTTLNNINIVDEMDGLSAITSSESGALAPGASRTYRATYSVTQADINAGVIRNTATATAVSPLGEVSDVSGTAIDNNTPTELPICQTDGIALVKTHDQEPSEGENCVALSVNDEITYTFVVTNRGNTTLNNINIVDEMDGLSAITSIESGALAPGASRTYSATYSVTQSDINAGVIRNTATATAVSPLGEVSDVSGTAIDNNTPTELPICQTDGIALVKTHDQEPSEGENCVALSVNDEITYTFVITNRGNTTLNNINIVDEMDGLSAITSSESGALAPGASRTYSATYRVTQSDINAGVIRNTATATAVSPLGEVSDVSGTAIDNNTPTELPICQTDGIALVKTHDQEPSEGENCVELSVNDEVTYTFVVTNRGNTTLNNISIVDEMAGLSAITSSESGALAPGASRTYSATYRVTQSDINAGVIRNTATATAVSPLGEVSDVSGTSVDNNTPTELPICQTDGIALVKTHDQQPGEGENCLTLEVDDVVTYTFVVTNRGNTTLNNISIVDEMDGLSAITSTESGALAPGASRTYSATYRVTQSDINAGVIRNTATATAVSPLGEVSDVSGTSVDNNTPTELPICQTDGIALVKTHDQEPGEGEDCVELSVNDEITYTFVVTNRGNTTLNDINIVDEMAGLSAITSIESGALAPGASRTYSATYRVTQSDINAGVIRNTATATAVSPLGEVSDVSGTTIENDTPTELPICQTDGIALVKTHDQEPSEGEDCVELSVNDEVTYTFVVTNRGNTTLNNINIVDEMDGLSAITSSESGALAPGASRTYSATYRVTQSDINAGVIRNTATATAVSPLGEVSDVSGTTIENDTPTELPICQTDGIALVKTHDQQPGEGEDCVELSVNDEVTYTFVVTNRGNTTLNNISIVDEMDGLSAITSSESGALAPGASRTYSATYRVTQSDINAGVIRNTATATAVSPLGEVSDVSGTSVDNNTPTELPICQTDGIALVKTHDQEPGEGENCVELSVNDEITYTFVVTNRGNTTLNNINIVDEMAGLSAITSSESGALAPGASRTYSATYRVTQSDINAGVIRNTATATAVSPLGDVSDVSGTAIDNNTPTELPICQTDGIALVKTHDQEPSEGENCLTLEVDDVVTYTFVVTNRGNTTLNNISIVDEMAGLSAITSTESGALAPGASRTYSATYRVTQSDINAGVIRNTATATAVSPLGDVSDVSGTSVNNNTPTELPICQTDGIALVKTHDQEPSEGEDCVELSVNDEITYTFVVTNRGNTTLNDINIVDEMDGLSAITSSESGALAPGASRTYSATYRVTQSDINAGVIRNTATATAVSPLGEVSDVSGTSVDNNTPTELPICQTDGIALVKTHDQEPGEGENCLTLEVDDVVTYTFVVTNRGNTTLNNISIVDEMAGLSAITSSESGALAPGASRIYSATYRVTQSDINAGVIRNTATATAVSPLGDVSDVSGTTIENDTPTELPICQTDGIALVKTHDQEPSEGENCVELSVNDEVTYTFVVTNRGNTTLNNISIVDEMAGLSAITSSESGALAPGASRTYSATYRVTQSDINAGVIRNTATATAVSPLGDVSDVSGTSIENNNSTELNICRSADIALVKTGVYQGDASRAEVGDEIVYTFTVTNTGNVTVNSLVVNDSKLSITDLAVVPATLAPGATGQVTASYTVTAADIEAGKVVNTAVATGTSEAGDVRDVSGTAVDNDTETETTLPREGSIALVKTGVYQGDASRAEVGDEIVYTFTVTNTGNVTVNSLVVNDSKLRITDLAVVPATLAPGATGQVTASYTVTAADIEAGKVVNTAVATGTSEAGDVRDVSGTAVDNDTETETTLPRERSIALVKTGVYQGDASRAEVGDEIVYTFAVTNTGNVTVNNLVVNDSKLRITDLAVVPATLAPGATGQVTASYTVTAADIEAGKVVNTAVATGTSEAGDVHDVSGTAVDNDTETETTLPQDSRIALIKTHDKQPVEGADCVEVRVGDVVTYTFVVTNVGNTILNDINIVDDMEGLSSISSDETGNLAVGRSRIFKATYTVRQADLNAGVIRNTAVVTAISPQGEVTDQSGTALDNNTATELNICQSASVALVKTHNKVNTEGEDCAVLEVGEELTYTFVVTNTGNVTLSNVKVDEEHFTGAGGIGEITLQSASEGSTVSSLLPGGTLTYRAPYTVEEADINEGGISNQAKVTAMFNGTAYSDLSGTAIDNDEATELSICKTGGIALIVRYTELSPETFRRIAPAMISLAADEDCEELLPNQPANYTLTVVNIGGVTLNDIQLSDELFTGAGTPGPKVFRSASVGSSENALLPGGILIYDMVYDVQDTDIEQGSITYQAKVSGRAGGTLYTDLSGADMVTNEPEVINICQNPELVIEKVANAAEIDKIGQEVVYTLTVRNTGNLNLTDVSVLDPMFPEWAGTIPTLKVGESKVFTLDYTVTAADFNKESVNNQAIVRAKDVNGNEVEEKSEEVIIPIKIINALSVNKSANLTEVNKEGQVITYTITVRNDGNQDLSDVVVTDPLTGMNERIGVLGMGEEVQFTTTYTVSLQDFKSTNIKNVATAEGVNPQGESVKGTDEENTTVKPRPLFIPNVFTPNGDGTNDTFEIVGIEGFDRIEVLIINRWGNEVYRNGNYRNEWNGANLNEGTYYYIITTHQNGRKDVLKGDVLIKKR